ncbi:MAG TPA: hypothetical protein VL551_06570 [Actinospica sp.]|jgi:nitroreductase|nr:hypothetical protein [Actinospica sp.]
MGEQATRQTPARAVPYSVALRSAVAIAALSPSSHNCQPVAVVRMDGRDARDAAAAILDDQPASGLDDPERAYLALCLDDDRTLGALPAHAVEMQLSCGLYGQALLLALAAHGWAAHRIKHLMKGTEADLVAHTERWPANLTPLCVVELRPSEPTAGLDALHTATLARRTNRAPYRPDPVAADLIASLTEPADALAHGSKPVIRHLSAPAERDRFADFVARHGARDFAHDAAWRETYSFIRRTDRAALESGDGFALSQLFGPLSPVRGRLLTAALAPGTMRMLRRFGYPRLLAGQLAAVVRQSPVVVMMSLPKPAPTPDEVVGAGAHLAEYWLRATRAGLALHPVSIVLQHDDLREALQDQFDLPGRTYFVSRLGYPATRFPPSPRRPASAALHVA